MTHSRRGQRDDAAGAEWRFTIGEIDLDLRSDAKGIVDELAGLYPRCRSSSSRNGCIRLAVMRRRRRLLGAARYDIVSDGVKMTGGHREENLLPHLEWAISGKVIETCSQYLQIHAASLSFRGMGAILAGPSGAGKSTLAAGLLAGGWKYMCDEFALVEPESVTLRPFPKALCVKSGAFEIVRELDLKLSRNRPYVKTYKGNVGYISPRTVPRAVAERPASIGMVLFPKYTGQRTPCIRPLLRGRAAFNLAAYVLNTDAFADRGLSTIRRIVDGARCFVVETGSIGDTIELIKSIAGQGNSAADRDHAQMTQTGVA
ncbi:MAG: hypothetical protein JSV91_00385 [Phycisphaerales bacterium]|nr:MAG: hypothetical protein JSV91_00385 [Phycisphaerales bacterium]